MDGFHLILPVDLAVLVTVRYSLSAWLEDVGVADPPRADVVLATHEAVANAIEHAGSTEPVKVDASFLNGDVTVEVRDSGRWKKQPVSEERGRGLRLIRSLVAEVEILKEKRGTTLRLVEHA
jgi:anti-sigma regulatory factor (Ser/Thr protein kinase)